MAVYKSSVAIVQHNRTTVALILQISFLVILNVSLGMVFTETVTYHDISLTTGLYEKYTLVNFFDLRCESGISIIE